MFLFGLFGWQGVFAGKIKVIERSAYNGGLFGYKFVDTDIVTYTSHEGGRDVTRNGYVVNCSEPGLESCPKLGAEYRPGGTVDDWDATQVNKVDELMEFALKQINLGQNAGVHSVSVLVNGESYYRNYEVIWDSTNGKIVITREDFRL